MKTSGHGAIGLYSAVGDALAGRRIGFGRRRAALAARFARRRGGDEDAAAASWLAGALADIGLIGVVLEPDATDQKRLLALADAPLYGARIVAALPGAPPNAADIVRWHREHDDGTGIPDRLRWDGIPAAAASLGIVHAFLEALEDPEEPRDAAEALFMLVEGSGRRFRIELVRAFREFVTAGDWDTPDEPELPAADDDALLAQLAARMDDRDSASRGRSARLAGLAATVATRLDVDPARAARLARLIGLGRASGDVARDEFDPLSRFARERQFGDANRAAAIAASVPAYAGDAPLLAESAGWHEEGALSPLAAILALTLAVDALPAVDARRRVSAAAGTQFDPAVARAYLAGIGAAT